MDEHALTRCARAASGRGTCAEGMSIHHGSHQTWTDMDRHSLLACYQVEEERLLLLSYIHAGHGDGSLRQKVPVLVPVPWAGCHPSTHPTPWHPHAERHHSFLQVTILVRCVALRLQSQVLWLVGNYL